MNTSKFISFHVKRYRSLLDVKIEIGDESPVIICGENNIGKTNFLRALNVFFNNPFKDNLFVANRDIPHHIFYGSQGSGSKSELTGTFEKDGKTTSLKATFDNRGEPTYLLGNKTVSEKEVQDFLSNFQFLYIESHNVDLPKLISAVLEKDGLLPLDAKRKKQSEPLKKLEEFIDLSQKAISDIEHDINQCFEKFTDFEGVLKNKQIRINFAEFEKLRDVVKTMTSITLSDGNNHDIESKGSGAQRAVFLALMQFVSNNSKHNVIWGIDEPEAFLQPRLQKKVAKVFHEIVSTRKQSIILTTHSQHFIELNNLKTTYIFKGSIEKREYARKPNQDFFEINAIPIKCNSDFEKASLIKQHLGINNNDGWEVMPYNLLVEGEEDKKYLETLFQISNLSVPNIVWTGGASKFIGYLQYYNVSAQELTYKPKFICIFDNDPEGREQSNKLKSKKYDYLDVSIEPLPRHDSVTSTKKGNNWEIEDFLPQEYLIQIINTILKKNKYKIINTKQTQDRFKTANIEKQILEYAEECSRSNNLDKSPFVINDEGRKKEICLKFCHEAEKIELHQNILNDNQIEFLKKLVK